MAFCASRPEDSIPSWSIRFATDLEQVKIVLSGMSDMAQIEDNMRDLAPLSEEERELLAETAKAFKG